MKVYQFSNHFNKNRFYKFDFITILLKYALWLSFIGKQHISSQFCFTLLVSWHLGLFQDMPKWKLKEGTNFLPQKVKALHLLGMIKSQLRKIRLFTNEKK
jgi:hypothetical protein